MLAKLIMNIEHEDLNSNVASLFHGYLMNVIDYSYADYLHYNEVKQFTSTIYMKEKKWYWKITTLTKKAYEEIILKLLNMNIKTIYLEHKDIEVEIKGVEVQTSTYEEVYLKSKNIERLHFVTPTSYKSDGKYQIFPSIKVLLSGVANKINKFSDSVKIDPDELEKILASTDIRNYSLRTTVFSLSNAGIKSFLGYIDIYDPKDDYYKNIISYLINMTEYTGTGVKTSLGMGGTKVGK